MLPEPIRASAKVEESGFEALQHLYTEAVGDEFDVGRISARLLLGLYNGRRFPFDLTNCACCRWRCSRT